ncbi:MAG: histidine phosphotransferase family protein [Rhizobiaceae bacterium]|jgi:histidine phosphotransferase ChpT|nr:histidine phosphotransferase family protein [Rhizobiaceae bacterium]
MADIFTLSPGELASLLCSRICHDVISPVGALNNGLELLDEPGAEADALALIKVSARNASARLQFARIAFGAAGSAGSQIDTGDAEQVASAFMANEKSSLVWKGPRAYLPKAVVKLILNMILIANGSVPRGGTLDVELPSSDNDQSVIVKAAGPMIRVSDKFIQLHNNQPLDEAIDAHAVQYYYTLLLAKEAKMALTVNVNAERVLMTAKPV